MKKTLRVGLGATLALTMLGVGVSVASAADTIPSDPKFGGTLYLADPNTELALSATNLVFNSQIIAQVSAGDANTGFPAPTDATGAATFIAPQGHEGDPTYWNASAPNVILNGANIEPNLTLTNQINPGGSNSSPNGQGAVKAAGGSFSIGLAFTKANGTQVADKGLFYIHITMAPGGAYTYATVCNGTLGDCGVLPPESTVPGSPATQGLSAQVTVPAVVDGLLSLTAPAVATSTIGNASIVNGSSTSTGALGNFQVQDGRAASKPGWTLTTSNVADFVNGSTTIGKQNLGFAPKNVSGVAATLGAAQVAGTAVYPSLFAQMAAGAAGTTTLDADLTFVAPAGSPSGTYTSTLTVTLVSK